MQLGLVVRKKRELHGPLVPAPPVGSIRVNSGRSESSRAHQNRLVPLPNRLSPIGTTKPPSEPPGSHPNHLSPIRTPWVALVRVHLSVSEFSLCILLYPFVSAPAPPLFLWLRFRYGDTRPAVTSPAVELISLLLRNACRRQERSALVWLWVRV